MFNYLWMSTVVYSAVDTRQDRQANPLKDPTQINDGADAGEDCDYLTPSGEISAAAIGRVRSGLIDPLIEDGMRKVRERSAEDHSKWLDRLARALAYLRPEFYPALREAIAINASGKHKNTWPELITICNFARAYQRPPARMSPMIIRYMRSQAGRDAWSRGDVHALALFRYLRRANKPPMRDASWVVIANDADDIAKRRAWCGRGLASDGERAALQTIERDLVAVRALVFPGEVSA